MLRLLAILFLVGLFLILLRLILRLGKPGQRADSGRGRVAHDAVSCAYCRLYVPREEAIRKGDRHFCCAEHGRAFERGNSSP